MYVLINCIEYNIYDIKCFNFLHASRSRSQGQICWYPWEGLVSRNLGGGLGALFILLGTDLRLRFSKYHHLYIFKIFETYISVENPDPYHNIVIDVINAGDKFTTH
jgi:hypothetical protein